MGGKTDEKSCQNRRVTIIFFSSRMDPNMNNYLVRLSILLACTLMTCGSDEDSGGNDYLEEADTQEDAADSETDRDAAEGDAGFVDADDAYSDAPDVHDPTNDADATSDTGDEEDATPQMPLFECPAGSTVVDGWNTLMVDGVERAYHVDLPSNTSTQPGMIFAFHGFSGTTSPEADTQRFRGIVKDDLGVAPDARADLPFILVLFEDTNLQPLNGLDWDIRTDSPNVDLPVFEATVGCLQEHQNADPDKIFAFGFSAGAVFANLIHTLYPEFVRAIVSESGLWLNEAGNLGVALDATLGLDIVDWDWPELGPIGSGDAAVLITRGGPGDSVPGTPGEASLDDAGVFARDWLQANGRVVIDCPHNGGHTLHPQVRGEVILDFFAAHATPGPSPLLTGDLAGLPASCSVLLPE